MRGRSERPQPSPGLGSGTVRAARPADASVVKRLRAAVGATTFGFRDGTGTGELLRAVDASCLAWRYVGDVPSGELELTFSGPTGRFSATVQSRGVDDEGHLLTSAPGEIRAVRVRKEARALAPMGVSVTLSDATRRVTREAHDLSDGGLSVRVSARFDRWAPGDRFDVVIDWQRRLRIVGTLEVRHEGEAGGQGVAVAGGVLSFAHEEDEARWHELVDALMSPLTRAHGLFSRDIWELFDTAGYLSLSHKKPADFESLRGAFREASRRLSRQPPVGAQIVLPSSRGLETSISALAEYPETVALYHMARRPGPDPRGLAPKAILRATYEHALRWVRRSGRPWLSVWVQDVTPFACGVHRDFALARADGRAAGVFTFHALEIAADAAARPDADVEVRAASPAEVELLAARLADHFAPPLATVRAWDAPSLLGAGSTWAHAERERLAIVALRGGELVAGAVLESMPLGTHLFGIFDTLHAVPLRDGPDETAALLRFASAWFAARGKAHFVYASERPANEVPGARDLGLTHDTFVRTSYLGELHEHLWHLTAPSP